MADNYDELFNEDVPVKPLSAPAPEPDGYDELFEEDAQVEKKRLADSMYVGTTKNPDAHAKALSLANKTNVPSSLVTDNTYADLQKKYLRDSVDPEVLLRSNPRFTKFLSLPDNAGVVHDDIPAMKEVDDMVDDYSFTRAISQKLAKGVNSLLSGAAKTPALLYDVGQVLKAPSTNNFYNAKLGLPEEQVSPAQGEIKQAPESMRHNFATEIFDQNNNYNMGIFGGTDINFINKYSRLSLAMIENVNIKELSKDSIEDSVFFEQKVFARLVNKYNKKIEFLLNEYTEQEAEELGYTHLIGDIKYTELYNRKIRARLYKEFPKIYNHCLKLEMSLVASNIKASRCLNTEAKFVNIE